MKNTISAYHLQLGDPIFSSPEGMKVFGRVNLIIELRQVLTYELRVVHACILEWGQ